MINDDFLLLNQNLSNEDLSLVLGCSVSDIEKAKKRLNILFEDEDKGISIKKRYNSGKRSDLGVYFRSSWEANYARLLNWFINNDSEYGLITWWYEPFEFEFKKIKRGNKFYTPDFLLLFYSQEKGFYQEFHEVKGYMDNNSRIKLKRFYKYYPEVPLFLIDGEVYNEYKNKFSSLVEGWE